MSLDNQVTKYLAPFTGYNHSNITFDIQYYLIKVTNKYHTESLSEQPTSHTYYSNRSQAVFFEFFLTLKVLS